MCVYLSLYIYIYIYAYIYIYIYIHTYDKPFQEIQRLTQRLKEADMFSSQDFRGRRSRFSL